MRIGELLVEQRKLRPSDLARALAEQPPGNRLASFLIAGGLVEFDSASRALGELKGVPCALTKHLVGRDFELASLLPAELGRALCALPIGRNSKGSVIVCVRDPAPALLAALRQASRADITMVIAPATRLEHLVREEYGEAPTDEFDVDMTTGVNNIPAAAPPTPPAPPVLPPLPDLAALDADSVRMALTDLDDVRVAKDHTQSGQISKVGSPLRPATEPPVAQRPSTMSSLTVGLEVAGSREAATDLVLGYVATRWRSALVLLIRDKSAIGFRGCNVEMPELVSVPLSAPSTIQRAVETRFMSAEVPASPAQDTITHALRARSPAAAPILVGGQAVAVMVVGEPLASEANPAAELAVLAEALGAAYKRLMMR